MNLIWALGAGTGRMGAAPDTLVASMPVPMHLTRAFRTCPIGARATEFAVILIGDVLMDIIGAFRACPER